MSAATAKSIRQAEAMADGNAEENGRVEPLAVALAVEPNAALRAELAVELCQTFTDPLAWLMREEPVFGGRTPLEFLRLGYGDKVLSWVLTIQHGGVS